MHGVVALRQGHWCNEHFVYPSVFMVAAGESVGGTRLQTLQFIECVG